MSNRQIEQNKNMVDFYVEEDRRTEVKDCFKLLRRLLEKQIEKHSGDMSLCDVGCATGDLLWYLSDCCKENAIKFCGVDVSEKLLDIARNRMPHVDFVQCDIMNTSDFSQKFDAVICFGVLSLFEDWKQFLLGLCNLSTRGGHCYVFVPFNPYGYSVKFEYSWFENDEKCIEYVPSIQAVSRWIEEKGWGYRWHQFNIGVDIPKHKNNYPVRAWTERLPNGTRMIRDALDRIQEQYILEILC